ncbi:hypothetical protein [Thiothrix subterranea]|uniref:Lipoprotein n=1 Tax=Thiothrix subterranea TaxID=2735563 RepID=A0AA51MMU5_9GAMM|nr:hypothetical protein [Thiothrix subterranea]MDQ5770690.1 hypothetical protein [Thiothrix subterranea]WML85946.1 hypothetical protein RCG00_16785 [Thiothrix subterranea]
MKTIPIIAMTFVLVLSLPACTIITSSPATVKPSVATGDSLPKLKPAFHQLERDGAPISIPVSADYDASMLDESALETPSSMQHTVVSILGQIVVACATSGHCW